jgi:hypothetical protein
MARFVVHAAKIPETLQKLSKDTRQIRGNMAYVNACDDKPWSKLPEGMPLSEAVRCPACAYVVEAQPPMRKE